MTKSTIDRVSMIGQLFLCGCDESGGTGKPPDFELFYFYLNVRECTGLHDIISLGLPSEAMDVSIKKKKARVSPTTKIMENIQKGEANFNEAVASMTKSFNNENETNHRVALVNELESLETSLSKLEEEKIKYIVLFTTEQSKPKDEKNKTLLRAYKDMVTTTTNRVKTKEKAISNVNEQLELLNKKAKPCREETLVDSTYKEVSSLSKDMNELIDSGSSVSSLDLDSDSNITAV